VALGSEEYTTYVILAWTLALVKLETETHIALPPSQVWHVLTDFETFPEWNPLFEVIGKPELDSKLTVKVNAPDGSGTQYEFWASIVDFEPGKRLAWKGGPPGLISGCHYWHLSTSQNGTHLVHGEDFYGLYVWAKGVQYIRSFRSSYEEMNEALAKYALEHNSSVDHDDCNDPLRLGSQYPIAAQDSTIASPSSLIQVSSEAQSAIHPLPPPPLHQPQELLTPPSETTLEGHKTNIQTTQTLEGTAQIYEASGTHKKQRGLLKVLLPSTVLVGSGVVGFLLWGPSELGRTTAQLSQLHEQAKYSECIDIGESTLSAQTMPAQQVLNPLSKCYLEQANHLAAQNKFGDAVQLIAKVSDQSFYHLQAQKKLNVWSARLLQEARREYEAKGNLKQALAWVEKIPQKSVVKSQAKREAKQWQDQHTANQQKIDAAKKALRAGRAEDAIASSAQIKAPEYWQKIADQVQQEAKADIEHRSAPEPLPTQTATGPTWRSEPAPPAYQPPAYRSQPRPAPPVAQPAPTTYQPPSARPAPVANPPAVAPEKEVVNICPGPLCTE